LVEVDKVLGGAVAVVVVDWNDWSVDWKLFEVGSTVTIELGIKVGEDATLEEWVFRKIDASYDVAWLEL
jgi:hypothetical protein